MKRHESLYELCHQCNTFEEKTEAYLMTYANMVQVRSITPTKDGRAYSIFCEIMDQSKCYAAIIFISPSDCRVLSENLVCETRLQEWLDKKHKKHNKNGESAQ